MCSELAITKGSAGIRSASRADKATIVVSEALGPKVYGRAGGGRCERPPHSEVWHRANALWQEGKQVLVEAKRM